MKNKKYLLFIAIIIILIFAFFFWYQNSQPTASQPNNLNTNISQEKQIEVQPLAEPIENAKARVTKKPFGIQISSDNSPVSPEKFSGYHTGTDFETTAEEQDIDIAIYAICDGNLITKKQATGYGGVAVQTCQIDDQLVTVVYGHLKLSSINLELNTKITAGTQIGILGQAYSSETDNERKHLHLSIHKGEEVNILGYVKNKTSLTEWLDVLYLL
jgi:murein DD-endopeptidase MepM/ murein hydrolase activator NlpD